MITQIQSFNVAPECAPNVVAKLIINIWGINYNNKIMKNPRNQGIMTRNHESRMNIRSASDPISGMNIQKYVPRVTIVATQ